MITDCLSRSKYNLSFKFFGSDGIAVLSLPIMIVWRVRLPLRKKLILMAVFSLTVIVMAVSIIRVAVAYSPNQNFHIAWLYFWSNIELTTCKCFRVPHRRFFFNLDDPNS